VPHHVKIRPVRLRGYSAELDCDTSRIVGYRAECSCGARSRVAASVRAARVAPMTHAGMNAV